MQKMLALYENFSEGSKATSTAKEQDVQVTAPFDINITTQFHIFLFFFNSSVEI